MARAVHDRSPRQSQAFVPIHCGALPREVLESELFGHERGAFTGAVGTKPGLIELADGGTLFLDEIGEMEPESQVRLLRVLETKSFFRVGGTRSRTVDMRLVAATNRDLADAIRNGRFRQDLFYRINTITIDPARASRAPGGRPRPRRALRGAQRRTTAASASSAETLAALEAYDWPGNVRELQHAIERAVHPRRRRRDPPADLPAEIQTGGGEPVGPARREPRGHGAAAHHLRRSAR